MTETRRHGNHRIPAQTADSSSADFKVCFSPLRGWQVTMVSERARQWAGQNLNSDLYEVLNTELTTDLDGVNSLLHRARMAGLAAEYLGPFERVRL